MVFIFLAYFTLYSGLQFHPSHLTLVSLRIFIYKMGIMSTLHSCYKNSLR